MTDITDDAADAAPSEEPAPPRRRQVALWLVIAGLAVLALPAALVVAVMLGEDPEPQQLTIEVPAGTGDRIAAGEDVQLLPPEVRLAVGDRMLVRNFDDQVHTVGPFTVRPGESILQVFDTPGTFEGDCTLIPSRKVAIIVT